MATAQVMFRHDKRVKSGIRPIQGQRDMPAIVELIEIGFGEELDPKGRKMLEQMRRVAQYQRWAQWLSPSQPTPKGLVWVEDGRVVGNLSLRAAYPRHTGGWLIGNVVVHPEFLARDRPRVDGCREGGGALPFGEVGWSGGARG